MVGFFQFLNTESKFYYLDVFGKESNFYHPLDEHNPSEGILSRQQPEPRKAFATLTAAGLVLSSLGLFLG